MVLGGDKVVPVLNFDDKPISPQRGPITTMIQEWYEGNLSMNSHRIKIASELLWFLGYINIEIKNHMSLSSSTVGGKVKYKIVFLGDQHVGKTSII